MGSYKRLRYQTRDNKRLMFNSRKISILGGDKLRDQYSLAFDGTNDYLAMGHVWSSAQTYTVSCWIKYVAIGTFDFLLGYAATARNFGLHKTATGDNQIFFRDENGDYFGFGATSNLTLGQWHHLTFTSNATVINCYIDGNLLGTITVGSSTEIDGSTTLASTRFTFYNLNGAYASGGVKNYEVQCNISDVAAYTSYMTASQVKTLYNGREPYNHKEGIATSTLVGWWRMGDGALDEGIINTSGNNSGIVGNEVSHILGSEVVTGWTNGSFGSVTIDGLDFTNAVSDGSGNHNIYSSAINATVGEVYKVSFTISGTPGSALTFRVSQDGSLNSATWVSGNILTGDFIFYFDANVTDSTTHVGFRSSSQVCDFSLTNFSLREVNSNIGAMINMEAIDFEGDTP